MRIIDTMRQQTAILWEKVGVDGDGQPTYGEPVGIDCRWEDTQKEFLNPMGETRISSAVVYVDRVIEVGSKLLLADIDEMDSSAADLSNPNDHGAREVVQFGNVPTLKNDDNLYTCFL
jgi:hypothetical protein